MSKSEIKLIEKDELVGQILFNYIKNKIEKEDFEGLEKILDPNKSKNVIASLKEFKETERLIRSNIVKGSI